MRKISFIFLFLLAALFVQARHLSGDEALQKALSTTSHRALKARGMQQYKLALSSDALYAYNNRCGGYVILAADDCVEDIVLGYSDDGVFRTDDMPEAMRGLLYELGEEVKVLAALKADGRRAESSLEALDEILPLTKSRWNQNAPYNLLAPEQYNAGCVATAMAQVMYYHRWPEQGRGAHSYSWIIDTAKNTNYSLSADFSAHTYDWEHMRDSYDNSNTDEERNAVAQLLLDCGISVETWYRSGTSLGYTDKVYTSLFDYFDYDASMMFVHRNYYTKREWRDMLYGSLAEGCPIYYRGKTQSGDGHAFICDGYKDGLFHINWGWGGMSDGYFQIALLDPAEQGLGGSTTGYQCEQKAILGVRPQCGGAPSNFMYCTNAFYSAQNSSTTSKTATFYGTFVNQSIMPATYTLGIKAEDMMGNVQYAASSYNPEHTFKREGSMGRITIALSDLSLTEGQYILTPAFLDVASGEWHDIRVLLTQSERNLIMTVAESGKVTFATPQTEGRLEATAIAPKWKSVAGYDTDVDFTVTTTQDDYLNDVFLAFLEKGSDKVNQKSDRIFIDVTEGEQLSYSASIANPSEAGDYDMVLLDASGSIVSERVSVTVEAAPSSPLALTSKISCKSGAVDELRFNVSLKCTGGVLCSKITVWIYDTANNGMGSLTSADKVFLAEGDNQDVVVGGAMDLKPNSYYYAHAYYIDASGNWQWLCQVRFRAKPVTGIDDIMSLEQDSPVYNLSGQKMSGNPSKGVYIINGKKIIK